MGLRVGRSRATRPLPLPGSRTSQPACAVPTGERARPGWRASAAIVAARGSPPASAAKDKAG